jgi:Fe-S-cluster-containing dehydrogenase component
MSPLDQEFSGPKDLSDLDRRDFLKYMGLFSSMTLLAHCSRAAEKIVPYSKEIDAFSTRNFELFTSVHNHHGFAQGTVVKSYQGRPIKIDGNPKHPFSLGTTSPQAQAALYDLYHPGRMKDFNWNGKAVKSSSLLVHLQALRSSWGDGSGVVFVYPPVHSPTQTALIKELQALLPKSSWISLAPWKTTECQNIDLTEAKAVACFDEDIFYHRADYLKLSRDFMSQRLKKNRLYVYESSPTLAGAKADQTKTLKPQEIWNHAVDLAQILEGKASANEEMKDLAKKLQNGAVFIDPKIHPQAANLEAHINRLLKAKVQVRYFDLPDNLSFEDFSKQSFKTIVMLDSDVVQWYPELEQTIMKIPQRISISLFETKSTKLSQIQLGLTHPLEAWGDLLSPAGDVSVQQPLIRPLHQTISLIELLSLLAGSTKPPMELVQAQLPATQSWDDLLQTGVMAPAGPQKTPTVAHIFEKIKVPGSWQIKIQPDTSIGYGEGANNPVLQELPKQFSKLTWQNAFYINPEDAQLLGYKTQDVIDVQAGPTTLRGPVYIIEGVASKTIVTTLGYGQEQGSFISKKRGFNAFAVKNHSLVTMTKTSSKRALASTQEFQRISDHHAPVKFASFKDLDKKKQIKDIQSLYPKHPLPHQEQGPQWGMTIDLTTCTGCQACVLACQVENNIPFVGEEQVMKDRILHWIRIDTYRINDQTVFQPVPCMHCEKAPCEVVCPVNATVHGEGGLNEMVYNRCVGTRYCSNNCPYKVRRFNFKAYSSIQSPWNMGFNPSVTVRDRGVMEKCTFCVQNLKSGGSGKTACQTVCPTSAIEFGDIRDPKSAVSLNKSMSRDYGLLEDEGTIPRTTYLKVVRGE